MVDAGAAVASSITTGLLSVSSASPRISCGIVAENNIVWRSCGTAVRIRLTSGKNPMSNM